MDVGQTGGESKPAESRNVAVLLSHAVDWVGDSEWDWKRVPRCGEAGLSSQGRSKRCYEWVGGEWEARQPGGGGDTDKGKRLDLARWIDLAIEMHIGKCGSLRS
jgi:hypothetical protein